MYSMETLKKQIPEIKIKEYVTRMEKKELIRLGIIAGAAGALTITAAFLISKKLKAKKNVEIVEVNTTDLDEE